MENDIKSLLANVLFFKGLSDEELDRIREITVDRRYQRNQLVFSDGEEGLGFFLVVTGKVKVYKVSPEGKEKILHILGPGEPVGQVAVFAGESFPANAEAIARSRLLFFPRKAFVELIHDRPSLALNMLAILSNRLREFTVQIENLSLKEVPSRLASYLLYLSVMENAADTLTLNISKAQLASVIGTIPETLSRILNKMSAKNLIAVDGRTIRLVDRDNLELLSEHGRLVDI
ncbi:MAG: Crp/Fnr family transcriptional regulator [Desulfosarcina sp.]|nr:Crp/Fnr family transcriptional regulator [Desulfobacterales bacterium]